MIAPKRYVNDEFYMSTDIWYRMNADGFDYVSNFIRRHCVKEADMEYFNKSVEVIKFKLEHSQKLYIKISDEPSIHFLYRSDYNPRYMHEPWMDLNDAILNQSKDREQMSKEEFDALYNAKWPSNENSFISNGKTTDYELSFNTWYEVNKTEYDEIIRGLPISIHKSLWDDQIDYGYKCFITRSKIYISFEYVRRVDDETYILNISKAAPLTYARPTLISTNNSLDDIILRSGDIIHYTDNNGIHTNIISDSDGKRIKDSVFAKDNIIKIIRDDKVIYDQRAVDRVHKVEINPNIWNNISWAPSNPISDLVDKINKKEKVMEDNKLEAVHNMIKDYYEAQLEIINKEYENTVKQVKEKDENYKAAKEYVVFVNKRIDKEVQDEITIEDMPFTLTKDTHLTIKTVADIREERIKALKDRCALTKNLLGMCDTF